MTPSENVYTERLPSEGTEKVPADPARIVGGLRSIGYKFEQAVADLVDNSINARADSVLIRFLTDGEQFSAIAIVDNGDGMDSSGIKEAMRFGSRDVYHDDSLGKYGMGLKLASMSHAKVLNVVSRKNGTAVGRRWTPEGIANDWTVDVLTSEAAASVFNEPWQGLDLRQSGTIVMWKEIDRLRVSSRGMKATVRTLKRRLKKHLGLTFHRFIEDGRLKFLIDHRDINEPERDNYLEVEPLNPFKFSGWPSHDYPRNFTAAIDGVGELPMKAYICPPNSNAPEYKLGGNAAARQGFYFYRNDRLIQAGGWNTLVESEAEPHGSLARVRINLPPRMDSDFGLSVQKAAVITPPSFIPAVEDSSSAQGVTFDDFRRTADDIYRKSDDGAIHHAPMVPSGDIPPALTELSKRWFKDEGGKFRRIKISWKELDGPEIFEIDSKTNAIRLNERYRKQILGSRRRSKADLPLLKTAIFFLLKDYFRKQRISKKDKEYLVAMEEVIRAAAKIGKG